jgi:hypothetical protein
MRKYLHKDIFLGHKALSPGVARAVAKQAGWLE